jgi:hypothetical protein
VTDLKGFVDRRKHPRFPVQNEAYAVINNGSSKIGQIQNISKGGFSLRYLDNGEPVEGSYRVDIFTTDNDFYLQNLPFNTISDVFIDFEIPFSITRLRQCAGQFGELTQNLISQLDYFIKNYTAAET